MATYEYIKVGDGVTAFSNLPYMIGFPGPTGTQGYTGPQGAVGNQGYTGPMAALAASQYVVQGYLGSDFSVLTGSNSYIIPFVSDFDPQSWLKNPGVGASTAYASAARFQPNIAGYYEISFTGLWAAGSTTSNQDNLQAIKSSSGTFMLLQNTVPTATVPLSVSGTKMTYMNGSTDYVSFTAFTANSGNQNLLQGSATGQGTWFSAHLISYGLGYTGTQGAQGTQGTQGSQGALGPTGYTGPTGASSTVTGPTGVGSSVSITGYTGYGSVISVATGGTGLFGNSNLFFNGSNLGIGTNAPATALDVNGGVTIRNGYRPLYSLVSSGTSITVPTSSYGTHYDIVASTITGITIPTVTWASDSNGYWVFRNNTSGYLSIIFTYTSAATSSPTNPVVIPPANSTTMMVTYPGGTSSNYVLF